MSKPPKNDPPRVPPRTDPPKDNRPPTKPPQKAVALPAPSQGHLPPARRDLDEARSQSLSAVATHGGPGKTIQRHPDEEPTPGSAAATATAARESVSPPTGAGASFRLPATPPVPRFTAGEHRLYGHVGPPGETEAEVMARLIEAAS